MEPEKPVSGDGQAPENNPAPAPQGQAPTPRKADREEMAAQLRESVRRKRPWTFASCLLLVLVVALPVSLLAWWFWPRREPTELVVTAFDQVGEPGTKVVCRAQLETRDPKEDDFDLAGRELAFEEIQFQFSGGKHPKVKARTHARGVAAVDWIVPEKRDHVELTARYVTPDRRSQLTSFAGLFAWPHGTKVLLADPAALSKAGDKLWKETAANLTVVLEPGAAAALLTAKSAKFTVAYLATEPTRALTYQRVRTWLKLRMGPKGIPNGPVLGRLTVSNDPTATDWPKAVVAHLRPFGGKLVVLTKDMPTAEAYRAAGVRAIVIGQGGIGWADVAKELAK